MTGENSVQKIVIAKDYGDTRQRSLPPTVIRDAALRSSKAQ